MNKLNVVIILILILSLESCVSKKIVLDSCLTSSMSQELTDKTFALQAYLIKKDVIDSWTYDNVQKLLKQFEDSKDVERLFKIIDDSKKERASLYELGAWNNCCSGGSRDTTCVIIRNLFSDNPTANVIDLLNAMGKERFDGNLVYRNYFFWLFVYDLQYQVVSKDSNFRKPFH